MGLLRKQEDLAPAWPQRRALSWGESVLGSGIPASLRIVGSVRPAPSSRLMQPQPYLQTLSVESPSGGSLAASRDLGGLGAQTVTVGGVRRSEGARPLAPDSPIHPQGLSSGTPMRRSSMLEPMTQGSERTGCRVKGLEGQGPEQAPTGVGADADGVREVGRVRKAPGRGVGRDQRQFAVPRQ